MVQLSTQKFAIIVIGSLLAAALLVGCGGASRKPVEPPVVQQNQSEQQGLPPSTPESPREMPTAPQAKEVKLTYSYGDRDKVKVSHDNIVVERGQTLVIEANPPVTKKTRFMSSAGENNFYDLMQLDTQRSVENSQVFTAIQPGRGKVTIVPNYGDWDRATDVWVTVEP